MAKASRIAGAIFGGLGEGVREGLQFLTQKQRQDALQKWRQLSEERAGRREAREEELHPFRKQKLMEQAAGEPSERQQLLNIISRLAIQEKGLKQEEKQALSGDALAAMIGKANRWKKTEAKTRIQNWINRQPKSFRKALQKQFNETIKY